MVVPSHPCKVEIVLPVVNRSHVASARAQVCLIPPHLEAHCVYKDLVVKQLDE